MSQKDGAPRESCHMSCASLSDQTYRRPPLPSSLLSLLIVIVLRSMPTKKDLRNEVGAIVHTVANRALSDHTAKNIFGNVNYSKHFLQGMCDILQCCFNTLLGRSLLLGCVLIRIHNFNKFMWLDFHILISIY